MLIIAALAVSAALLLIFGPRAGDGEARMIAAVPSQCFVVMIEPPWFPAPWESGGQRNPPPGVAVPANIRNAAQVRVIGAYDPSSRVFHAAQLYTKCPSKYDSGTYKQPGKL